MPSPRFPIPQGTLDMLILQILALEPAHGYGIAQRLGQISRSVALVVACLFTVQRTWAEPLDFRLQVVPAIVYKVDDPGNTRTSSFVFDLAVLCSSDCAL